MIEVRDVVIGMAHAPLPERPGETVTNGVVKPDTDKGKERKVRKENENPLIAKFGRPSLVVGRAKEYPAKGFDGKVIADRWNTPLAVAVWTVGPGIKFSANISQTREIVQTEKGRVERTSIDMAVPKALSYDRKSAESVAVIDTWKAFVMDIYDDWAVKAKDEIASAKSASKRSATARVAERML